MTNISKDLRQILKDKFRFDRIKKYATGCIEY
jgi:adenine C2-methylase RlmN of 23S rRNA A2503 and tRNA A37